MPSDKVMLKCGHASNATDGEGRPSCAICFNQEVVPTPNLEGRIARCSYCKKKTPSDLSLPFFGHFPEKEYDDYYCGCLGWD